MFAFLFSIVLMEGDIYHSSTVTHNLKELFSQKKILDHLNRKIITLLAQGIKTKNLPNYLNISISTIEKRKANIRYYFNLEKGSDEDIIREAKRLGLV